MTIAVGEQSADEIYRQYLAAARRRWLSGQVATVSEIRSIYRVAAADVARDIRRLLPSQPSARHLRAIRQALAEAASSISEQSLRATLNGIQVAHTAAVGGAQAIALQTLGRAFAAQGIEALYHGINQRAVLAFATKTRRDGLRLSTRVWGHGQEIRDELARALESGVARGKDSRTLAREIQSHLDSTRVTPHSQSVRRRLKLSKSVDYRAMRLARTEIAMSFHEGSYMGHGGTPGYLGIDWQISGAHPFVDECDDLAGGGDGPNGIYPAGSEPLFPHPNCMCSPVPVYEELDQFLSRLDRWRGDPSSEAGLEDWFQNTAKPLFESRPTLTTGARASDSARTFTDSPVDRAITDKLARSAGASSRSSSERLAREAEDQAGKYLRRS